ncbi:MAG: hypothetical protein DMF58_06675 [Acidobacteria bacterium]|nr:MAG: hypothetical protein DMF58_06675 [Acidobacteriota bacterium]
MFRKALLACALFLIGCGKLKELPTAPGVGGEPIDPTATFTRVQNEIFTPTCAQLGCHDRLGRQEDQQLTASCASLQPIPPIRTSTGKSQAQASQAIACRKVAPI